jgi:hypothetical protein
MPGVVTVTNREIERLAHQIEELFVRRLVRHRILPGRVLKGEPEPVDFGASVADPVRQRARDVVAQLRQPRGKKP